jgi:hypothetical protein
MKFNRTRGIKIQPKKIGCILVEKEGIENLFMNVMLKRKNKLKRHI